MALPVMWVSATIGSIGLADAMIRSSEDLPWWALIGYVPFAASALAMVVLALLAIKGGQREAYREAPAIARFFNTNATWTEIWYRLTFGREYRSALAQVKRQG